MHQCIRKYFGFILSNIFNPRLATQPITWPLTWSILRYFQTDFRISPPESECNEWKYSKDTLFVYYMFFGILWHYFSSFRSKNEMVSFFVDRLCLVRYHLALSKRSVNTGRGIAHFSYVAVYSPCICMPCTSVPHLTYLFSSQNVCKNCRGTFCNACSTNELPLPSSIEPERVCNPCHEHLMKRYSTSPS